MTIPCLIEIDGVPYTPRKPYQFATLPRVGEWVALEWDDEAARYPRYTVRAVCHVPDDVQDLPAFTVLYVERHPYA